MEVTAEGFTVSWLTRMGEQGESVDIILSQDGTTVLEENFTPSWSEPYYPNGEACDAGNGCSSAEASFSF
jgi:hypothetical protein